MALGTIIRSFPSTVGAPYGLAWDGKYLWYTNAATNTIYQVDPVTGTVVYSFATPAASPRGICWDGRYLWHAESAGDLIHQVDPVTGISIRSFASPTGFPVDLAWDGRALWHTQTTTDRIHQIDPVTGQEIRSFPAPASLPWGLTWDGHSLWLGDSGTDLIYQIDPITGTVIRSAPSPDTSPSGLAWDGRTLWIIDSGTDEIYQVSVSGVGTYYYVDASAGNDANSGQSPAQAWQTMGKVNGETFLRGDRIMFKRGETWTGTALSVTWSGEAGHPIVFGAYGVGAKPIIDGNDVVHCISAVNQSYLQFENLDLSQGLSFGVQVSNCSYIDILGIDAHDCGNSGINIANGSSNITIDGADCYDQYQRVGGTTVGGIVIEDGPHDILIKDSTCRDGGVNVQGITIHNHPATVYPYNITIQGCTIQSNQGNGLYMIKADASVDTDRNILVQDCLVTDSGVRELYVWLSGAAYIDGVTLNRCQFRYPNGTRVIHCRADSLTFQECEIISDSARGIYVSGCQNLSLVNCTLYGTAAMVGDFLVVVDNARTLNFVMKDCIGRAEQAAVSMISVIAGAEGGADIDYNLWGHTGGATRWRWLGAAKTWANWLADSSQDANSPAPADPLFTNSGADDFTLQAGSPARGAGTDLGYGTDIGAYQYV